MRNVQRNRMAAGANDTHQTIHSQEERLRSDNATRGLCYDHPVQQLVYQLILRSPGVVLTESVSILAVLLTVEHSPSAQHPVEDLAK